MEEKTQEPKKLGRPPKEEFVQIRKDKLEEIMKRLERVEFAASKAQLDHFDKKKGEPKGKSISLRMIDGKVIISWSDMTKNLVEKNEHGVWQEDQEVELTFEDETKEKMPYVFFSRRYQSLPAKVIQEITSPETSEISYKVLTDDGKEYLINGKFIN